MVRSRKRRKRLIKEKYNNVIKDALDNHNYNHRSFILMYWTIGKDYNMRKEIERFSHLKK